MRLLAHRLLVHSAVSGQDAYVARIRKIAVLTYEDMKALVVFVDWFKQLRFEPVLEADPSVQFDQDGNEFVDFDARDLWRDECASRNDSRHEARAATRFPTLAMHALH